MKTIIFAAVFGRTTTPNEWGMAAGLELKRLRMKYFSTEQQHDVITAISVNYRAK